MAITGAWKARREFQSGAMKWGTGYNPIHAQRIDPGRQTAIYGSEPVPESLTDSGDWGDIYPAPIPEFGYMGQELDVYPSRDNDYGVRADTQGYPPWTENGDKVRAIDRGADATNTTRREVKDSAAAGWWNKLTGVVLDSRISDASQYTVQTSMQQRDQSRTGSQSIGREDEHHALIRSRIPGMKAKPFMGDPVRRNAMLPRQQDQVIRAWWARQAGTGDVKAMYPNATAEVKAMQRLPNLDADQGPSVGTEYGYTDEDQVW